MYVSKRQPSTVAAGLPVDGRDGGWVLLLNSGASVDAEDDSRRTALDYAAQFGSGKTVTDAHIGLETDTRRIVETWTETTAAS